MKKRTPRAFERHRCRLEAALLRREGSRFHRGVCLNISEGGMFMTLADLSFQAGEPIHFRVSFSAQGYPCLSGEGEVRWLRQAGEGVGGELGLGVRFFPKDEAETKAFRALVEVLAELGAGSDQAQNKGTGET